MDYIITPDGELYHYGVKGMKWGVHRFRDKSGSESSGPKKKHATDATSNEQKRYKLDVDREKAAKKLERAKTKRGREKAQEEVDRLALAKHEAYEKAHSPAARVNTAMTKIGTAYLADQIFFGGRGTRATKNAVKAAGILTISAIAKARGAEDIHWYDKYGRRIV